MAESDKKQDNVKTPYKSLNSKNHTPYYPGEEPLLGKMTAARMYTSASAPTVNNDSVDSGGIEQAFVVGDLWNNTTDDIFYILQDGTTGAAVWKAFDPLMTVAKQYGPTFWSQAFGEETPEHTNQIGSYDYTGGTFEALFTKTSGDDFTQADEDNGNWILLTGVNKGAIAEIKTYIDANNVIVHGFDWNVDFPSQTFEIYKHPAFITGDGHHHEFSVGVDGSFEVAGYNFTDPYVAEIELNSAANGTDGLKVEASANGYTAVQAIVADYQSGALGAGETGGAVAVRIDVTDAVAADSTTEIEAYLAVIIDGTSATTTAYKVTPGFTNALEVQGATAVDPDYGYDVTTNVVTDRVTGAAPAGTAFLSSSATDIDLFTAVSDYILIGNDDTFEVIEWTADTGGTFTIIPVFEFSTGNGTWSPLTVLADGTQGFQQSGQISFSAPGTWAKGNEAEAAADITSAYYIRITRARATNIPTLPVEAHFKIFLDRQQGMKVRGDGTIQPTTLADADAANNSIYYSSDQSKLVYKDGGGTVRDLY